MVLESMPETRLEMGPESKPEKVQEIRRAWDLGGMLSNKLENKPERMFESIISETLHKVSKTRLKPSIEYEAAFHLQRNLQRV